MILWLARGSCDSEVVRRALVLLVVVGAVVGVAVTSTRSRVAARPAAAAAAWSSPQVLVPASQYASNSQLAVSEQGATLAAWAGPPEPQPARGKGAARVSSDPSSATRRAFSGSSVVVDTGTVSGGFGPPVVLAEHAADTNDGLDIAISGTGVRYVAWKTYAGGWMIESAASGGSFSAPHALPTARYQPLRLVRSPAGPVAAVWFASIGETPLLRYALLHPDGTLGRTITVGRWSNASPEGTQFALNDRGEFAALDMVGRSEEGTIPPAPLVHICNPAGHCSRPHELQFGHIPAKVDENQAIALSNDGTVTVLASFSEEPTPPDRPLGFWVAVRRPGKRWSAPQEISNGGESPLAASDGNSSAVTVFQHFWTPKRQWIGDRIETSVLHAAGTRFATPDLVRGAEAGNPVALATTMNGGLLVAWVNSGDIVGGEDNEPGVYAVTGSATDPGAPQLVTGGSISDETPAAGIDSDRQGVILWTGSTQEPYRDAGVSASVFGVP